MKRPYRRKTLNFSINRSLQLRMIRRIALILFVSLLASASIYYYFSHQEITSSFSAFHIQARSFLDLLLPIVGAAFFVSLFVGTLVALFFPKHFVGGIYGIERDLRRVAEGDLSVRITLRKGDEVVHLADMINTVVENLEKRLAAVHEQLEKAQAACSSASLTSEEKSAVLAKAHREAMETLGSFKISR